jgi:uncharacterized protein YjbI with pentapeptide repeats
MGPGRRVLPNSRPIDGANFSGATLRAAQFDNAELAGTKYVEADLRGASFRSLHEPIPNGYSEQSRFVRTAYIDHIASALNVNAVVDITMPNFSCARPAT